jgi:GNAT superfamily N-acetyltransferase
MTNASKRNDFPLSDLTLARRLERTEAEANAAFVETRARISPSVGAAWMEVAGAYAMFDGAASPLTQSFGLGLFEPADEDAFQRLESFFHTRGAPVFHEVSPLADPELVATLDTRGYRPVEFSSVLVRPCSLLVDAGTSRVRVRLVDAAESERWAAVSAEGWHSESEELGDFVRGFGRVVAESRGAACFVAELEGRPIAAATLFLGAGTALLAGASTIPEGRRQGAQRALLAARLGHAAARGIDLAMMVAQPGSASQRNAERQGFRIAYTRLKWQLRSGA